LPKANSTVREGPQIDAHGKTPKNSYDLYSLTFDRWPWNSVFRAVVNVKVHVPAKFHQATCSGSWVTNSALDFGQQL